MIDLVEIIEIIIPRQTFLQLLCIPLSFQHSEVIIATQSKNILPGANCGDLLDSSGTSKVFLAGLLTSIIFIELQSHH